MRLTSAFATDENGKAINYAAFPIGDKKVQYEICQKLGQLEDIEEELGIDLITLFKILRDGIVVEDNKTTCFREVALSYSEDRKSWHFMFKQQLPLNQRIGVFVKSSKYRYVFVEDKK